MKAITETQRLDYLDEHLPYMLKMVRFTHHQLHRNQEQLPWNAFFEAFAVNARNLVNLLTNKDKKNVMAQLLVADFRRRKNENMKNDITNLMDRLDEQVFHLGAKRPREQTQKLGRDAADRVFKWIETCMAEFIGHVVKQGGPQFNMAKASYMRGPEGPSGPKGLYGWTGPDDANRGAASIEQRTATTADVSTLVVDVLGSAKK
jgi:hypothetical protein